MDVEKVKKDTMKLLGTDDEAQVAHITEELLAAYEDSEPAEPAEPAEGATARGGSPPGNYYGNSLVHGPPMGRVGFTNGSQDRPNDPCGTFYRRHVYLTQGSIVRKFRDCGKGEEGWGYEIVVLPEA